VGKSGEPPVNLLPLAAQALIRETVRSSSRVFLTRHAMERMRERGITRRQVFDCLAHG
jgi:hypothetical protein